MAAMVHVCRSRCGCAAANSNHGRQLNCTTLVMSISREARWLLVEAGYRPDGAGPAAWLMRRRHICTWRPPGIEVTPSPTADRDDAGRKLVG